MAMLMLRPMLRPTSVQHDESEVGHDALGHSHRSIRHPHRHSQHLYDVDVADEDGSLQDEGGHDG